MEITKAHGKLIAIGGAEDKTGEMRILKKFVEMAGGEKAKIVVMTVATDDPEKARRKMTRVFKKLGVEQVNTLDVSKREHAESKRGIELVSKATGLYFTGGDQLHITSLMGGTALQEIMQQRYEKDLLIAGTSAGAAMMGNSMILSGNGEENPRLRNIDIGPGMDLIIGVMVDTHFAQRGRHGRLLAAVAHYPQDLGIGIDENTAIIVKKDEFEVIGEGAVTIMDGSEMSFTNAADVQSGGSLSLSGVKTHVLSEGYKFNLTERSMVIPKSPRAIAKKAGGRREK